MEALFIIIIIILFIIIIIISDGLLKIWSSETSESVGSFDAHDDKIWAVESWNKKIVTGGRDGQMIMWRNITEQVLLTIF
jgi:hypothetical protein